MVARVHDAQHSQAVSPLRVSGGAFLSSGSIAIAETSTRPSPRAVIAMVDAQHEGNVTITAITRTDSAWSTLLCRPSTANCATGLVPEITQQLGRSVADPLKCLRNLLALA